MDNLIELKVFLQDPGFPEWDGMQCVCLPEREILAALWKVKRRLKVFEMDVPWVDTSSVQLDTEMHQPYLGLLSNYRINSIR